ncbi:MAG TPA: membrane protein insertase YidC [Halieaceae bacterium]|jgi:YidC/Oxa1 family membrane protein insertase|nr:membrane protein insertase YidC [Haliea sp.]HBQ41774.1 membrane protein insertase YidC [Halieaceae bacterium]MAD65774.1 membrane protein insertase YidC [Haliea sp.]MAY91930.1 membrane protein insertase YidC [Haliea sp.]MBK41854.1 membrane protein insertase YidC [Haliea sp.]MBP70281.1 membrane protein insertase YidC [Haliea sp.]|tara:strand:- start:330 stop:2060 length:1731 start_codon:yes stop_codon:yes gene_type:complete
MDFQRTLLIGAIALLSFMLLTEWVAFKDAKTTAAQPTASRLISSEPDGLPAANSELPLAPSVTAPSTGDEDLPQAPEAIADQQTAAPLVTESGTGSDIITVHTDVLQVAIDLQGGDIVELALPEHLEDIDAPDQPFVLLEQNERRIYVAQSGLIGPNGIDSESRARFTATQSRYELQPDADELQVDLMWQNAQGLSVTKRFTLRRGDYLMTVSYIVDNQTGERWQGNLFGQIKRDSSKPSTVDSSGMGLQPFLGAAITQPEERFTKFTFKDMQEEPFREQLPGGWIAMIQHYFLSAWIPAADQSHTYSTRVTASGFNIAGFTSPALVVDSGEQGAVSAGFYAGPKDQYRLAEISPYLDLSVDYGWLWWIAQPLFWLLVKIHGLVGNWGVAIILLTVLIKTVFFKLSATSYRSMANMRRVAPKMQDIREQYAEDKAKQSQAMMELYRKEKINPMGGCLPVLVQMPVFISLYWVLMESVELRHSPFFLWIEDLSVMDPYFVLPLLMGASMWFMQKLNPPPPDPMQAKIMQWLPVIFTFFFLWFPAGLVLYWVVNNLLSMAQQYVITRQIEKSDAKVKA